MGCNSLNSGEPPPRQTEFHFPQKPRPKNRGFFRFWSPENGQIQTDAETGRETCAQQTEEIARQVLSGAAGVADEVAFLAAKYGMPSAIAVVAVACRLLFSSARWSLLGVVRGVLVGVFVGYLAGAYVYDLTSMSDGEKGIAIAVSAILAEDLFVAVLSIGRKIRENPLQFLDMIRGRKP